MKEALQTTGPFLIFWIVAAVLVAGGALAIFVMVFRQIFSPKARARMMKRQVDAQKVFLDESEADLRDVSRRSGEIYAEGVEPVARAVRKGLIEDPVFCKFCGKPIDADSVFCKACGKKQ